MPASSKVKFKNKSKDKTKFVCDFCGKDHDELWEGVGIEGQYCLEHFREIHDDVEAFDEWFDKFGGLGE